MGLQTKDVNTGGGGWFKPKEEKEGALFLIEVKGFEHQRPTDYGPKDSATVNITTFDTQAELDAGTPSKVRQGCRIEQSILARDLEPLVGFATIVVLGKAASKKPGQQDAWVWRPATDAQKQAVSDWYDAKEAALAEAMASAPDFS